MQQFSTESSLQINSPIINSLILLKIAAEGVTQALLFVYLFNIYMPPTHMTPGSSQYTSIKTTLRIYPELELHWLPASVKPSSPNALGKKTDSTILLVS